jgi:hypothetical protein
MAITEATRTAFTVQASSKYSAVSTQPKQNSKTKPQPSASLRLRGENGGWA